MSNSNHHDHSQCPGTEYFKGLGFGIRFQIFARFRNMWLYILICIISDTWQSVTIWIKDANVLNRCKTDEILRYAGRPPTRSQWLMFDLRPTNSAQTVKVSPAWLPRNKPVCALYGTVAHLLQPHTPLPLPSLTNSPTRVFSHLN